MKPGNIFIMWFFGVAPGAFLTPCQQPFLDRVDGEVHRYFRFNIPDTATCASSDMRQGVHCVQAASGKHRRCVSFQEDLISRRGVVRIAAWFGMTTLLARSTAEFNPAYLQLACVVMPLIRSSKNPSSAQHRAIRPIEQSGLVQRSLCLVSIFQIRYLACA